MENGFNISEYYGLKPVPNNLRLSSDLIKIRNAKVNIVDTCNQMINLLETIKTRARNANEIPNIEQLSLMLGFEGTVDKAKEAVTEAVRYGYIKP